ncbi:MAG: hypothetical protein JWN25_1440 [Verrucomicrobiales bacterium]|nr:hypothetical protein [Verrucomicrobiales bacterium]
MSIRSILGLLCLAGGLFAFIVFFERPYHDSLELAKSKRLFPVLSPKQLSIIEIRGGSNTNVRAERSENSWRLTQPISYPADEKVIQRFLTMLENVDFIHHLSAKDLSSRTNLQEEFGFNSPSYTVLLKGAAVEARIEISTNSIASDQLFLQIVGGDGVYVLPAEMLSYLPTNANQWRSREVFSTNAGRASGILVKNAAKGFQLQKTNNFWRMVAPLECRANDSKVDSLLEELVRARVETFVTDDGKSDLESYGFLSSGFELQLVRGGSVESIQAGNSPTNAPDLIYVKRIGSSTVALVKKEIINAWKTTHADFRDKHLLSSEKEFPQKVIGKGEDRFEFSANNRTNWAMAAPFEGKGDSFYAERLLTLLTTNEVELEKSVVTDFAPYGLDKPCLRYEFSTNGQIATNFYLSIEFGTNTAGKVFAKRSDEAFVCQFPAEKLSYLPKASWQFLNHKPWSFQAKEIKSITIFQKNRIRKIIRNKDGEFIVAPGSQGFINPFSIEESIYRIGSLEVPVWESRGQPSQNEFGFEQERHQIVFQFEQPDRKDLAIDIGVTSALQIHGGAMIGGTYMVFELPMKLYYEFISNDFIVPLDPLKTK